MNKHEFIEEMSRRLNLDIDTCTKIDEIYENNFFISKAKKDQIIKALVDELNFSEEKATEVYNTSKKIFNEEIKNRILHPFR